MIGRSLTVAYAGTPEFAASVLAGLAAVGRFMFNAIYTQPDRRSGRGRRISHSPVKQLALQLGLPVVQPSAAPEFAEELRRLRTDVLIVVAYGMILPKAALDQPRHGCINLHASLLPRWRGAAPVQRAILAGDRQTGVTVMQMDSGLDTGDILLQSRCPIEPGDTALTLQARMVPPGIDCLSKVLDMIESGSVVRTPQDHDAASYAPKIRKAEAEVDWSMPAQQIERMVRAFIPAPVVHARLQNQEIRLWETEVLDDAALPCNPGQVGSYAPEGIDVDTGRGRLRILKLQLPGRNPISARDFYNANPNWHPRH